MKPVILIGGGGHCKSVIEAAISAGVEIQGILDSADKVGSKVLNYTVIGTDEDIHKYSDSALFVITIGQIESSVIRRKIVKKVKDAKGHFSTIIASTAKVSRYAKIGEGSVVLHGAMVNANVIIGEHCILNTLSNVEHDVRIGNFTHISVGVMVCGNCEVGNDVFIGSQSALRNGVSITNEVIIGIGGIVHKSIRVKGIYVGNPVRLLKKI